MNISEETLADGATRVQLSGRMDIEGVSQIEAKFAEMSGPPRMKVVVDMSDVPYMSSVGIRALLMTAKSVSKRGGKLAIAAPQANVRSVLVTSGIDKIIKIGDDLASAQALVA